MATFEGFDPVFGVADGQLDSTSQDLLPFLFYLRAGNGNHLTVHVTDFHANTWWANMSTEDLEDLVHNFTF